MKMASTSNKQPCSGIKIYIDIRCKHIDFSRRKFAEFLRKTAFRLGLKNAVINFIIVDDAEMMRINRKFLGKNKITDVISFDLSDAGNKQKIFDIVINSQLADRQAAIKKHGGQAELALYCLHGVLHQLGFDDLTAADAARMHKEEDKILNSFGYGKVFSGQEIC